MALCLGGFVVVGEEEDGTGSFGVTEIIPTRAAVKREACVASPNGGGPALLRRKAVLAANCQEPAAAI